MNPIAEEIMSYYGHKDAIDISQDVVVSTCFFPG